MRRKVKQTLAILMALALVTSFTVTDGFSSLAQTEKLVDAGGAAETTAESETEEMETGSAEDETFESKEGSEQSESNGSNTLTLTNGLTDKGQGQQGTTDAKHLEGCMEGCTAEDCACTCHQPKEPSPNEGEQPAAHIGGCAEGCTVEGCACTCHQPEGKEPEEQEKPGVHMEGCTENCTVEGCTCACHQIGEQNPGEQEKTVVHIEGCAEGCTVEGCLCTCHNVNVPEKEAEKEETSYKISFEIGADAAAAGVAVPDAVLVESGKSAESLPSPVWEDEQGNPLMIFEGWYTDENAEESRFDGSAAVTADVVLYAKWVAAVANISLLANEELEPDANFILVGKTFEGITQEEIPENFRIEVRPQGNGEMYTLTEDDAEKSEDGLTWRWKISNVGEGTYTVTESNYEIANYEVTTSGIGADNTVVVKAANFAVTVVEHETTCSKQYWDVKETEDQNFLFAATLTSNQGIMVISQYPLTATQRATVTQAVLKINGPWKTPVYFYSLAKHGTGPWSVNGKTLEYIADTEQIHIQNTSNWQHVAKLSYNISEASNPDINITNTYTPLTVPVTIQKQVTGGLGIQSKEFEFTVTSSDIIGDPTDNEYTLSPDKKTATFKLTHDDKITLNGIRLGSTLTIQEVNAEADGYTVTVQANGTSLEKTEKGFSYSVPSDIKAPITIVVTNNKEVIPDTGIRLDSLPYALILAMAAGTGILMYSKKRRYHIDG